MVARFTRRCAAVVTGTAGTRRHTAMVEYRRYPAIGAVAIIAGIVAGDVVRRLAGRRVAVMAAEAGPQHIGMVDTNNRCKQGRTVAVLAYIGRVDVTVVLADRRRAVMTGHTAAGHSAVIEHRAGPAIGGMAVITGVAAGNMVRRLAGRRVAVMAAEAGPQHIGMIDANDWRKQVSAVTVLAHIGRVDVTVVLADRRRAVMTGHTAAGHSAVIEHRAGPAIGGMAVITGVAAGNVVRRLAGRRVAVMTAEAGPQHIGMIDANDWRKQVSAVTVLAHIGRVDVTVVLANGLRPVVAGYAVAGYTAVIEHRAGPAIGGMAVITGVAAGNVVRRLAGRNTAIVTAEAGPQHIGMIDANDWRKQVSAVTGLAGIGRVDMTIVLANGLRPVVAGYAVAGYTAVIEHRAGPAIGGMAVITGVAAGNMVRRLAGRRVAVMAAEAGPQHIGMIDANDWRKQVSAVTGLAGIGRVDMTIVLANGLRPVVAGYAVAGYTAVIEHRAGPAIGGMAVITGVAAGNMVRRLAGRRVAVMAAEAGPQHIGMIDANDWRKQVSAVTGLAGIGRVDMTIVLANGLRPVVAGYAVAGYTSMIERRTRPGIGRVAIIAGVAAGNVSIVLTRGHAAVMTAEAGPQHLGMIRTRHRCKQVGVMAGLAGIGRVDVTVVLANGLRPVVAGHAVAGHTSMIKCRTRPGSRVVTVIAGVTAGDVVVRFTARYRAIVTTEAGTLHLGMIRTRHRCKQIGVMARLTGVCCIDVAIALADGRSTVVAGHTVAGYASMIERRAGPGSRGMAVIAAICAGNMIAGFTGRNTPVVAAETGTLHLGMVRIRHRRKQVGIVAGLAGIGRVDVSVVLAGCRRTVVTGNTITGYTLMSKVCRPPGNR